MFKNWFLYFLKKAIAMRRGRFILSTASVMLTVCIITALIMLSFGIREKLGKELRQYGANMIVTGTSGAIIDEHVALSLASVSEHIAASVSQLYGIVTINGNAFEAIGMDVEKLGGARIEGALPSSDSEIMVGSNLREILGVNVGDPLSLNGTTDRDYRIAAFFEKGSDEDSAIILSLRELQKVMKAEGVSAVLINADSRYLDEIAGLIGSRFPFLEVKTLKQVAVAEKTVLEKIQLLMVIVTAVVLFSSIIALGSTMGANVIERMEEIGLMKAIGATSGDIRNFFMSEAALAGLSGAILGYLLGIGVAELVSLTAFNSLIPINVFLVPVSLVIGVLIAVISTYFPVQDAMKVIPAKILRGE